MLSEDTEGQDRGPSVSGILQLCSAPGNLDKRGSRDPAAGLGAVGSPPTPPPPAFR